MYRSGGPWVDGPQNVLQDLFLRDDRQEPTGPRSARKENQSLDLNRLPDKAQGVKWLRSENVMLCVIARPARPARPDPKP